MQALGANRSIQRTEEARRFVEDTGVDALAVSIGTVHGILPKGYVPKLQLELLKELAAAVPVPLVLHGGSGTPHDLSLIHI